MIRIINFYIPDFYLFYKTNIKLIELMQEHEDWFYPGIKIGAVYGSFPNMIWNGGRVHLGQVESESTIKKYIDSFNSKKIPIRFTLTNSLLTEEHCFDSYCNMVLNAANNNMNGIIVNSITLEDYLRSKYSCFDYILSTTRCERDISIVNKSCDKYNMIVIDFRDNKNLDFINGIIQPSKIELLINAECNPDCELRNFHYNSMDNSTLKFDGSDINYNCPYLLREKSFEDIIKENHNTFITADELYNIYVPKGFTNFKIEGRLRPPIYAIESYIYYMVKPEWKNHVRYLLLRTLF